MSARPDAELNEEIATWPDRLDRLAEESEWVERVVVMARTESTQDAVAHFDPMPGTVVVAGRQTGGRGQHGRTWADDLGRGLSVSIVTETEEPACLCARAAVALASAFTPLLEGLGVRAGIKWPNDLHAFSPHPRKLAGVLVEERGDHAIVGIGVNVHARAWPGELADTAGTLEESGVHLTRLEAMVLLLEAWEQAMALDKEQLRRAFIQADLLCGKPAVFEQGGTSFEGVVKAVDPFSGVLLSTAGGEVSLRPELARLQSWGGC